MRPQNSRRQAFTNRLKLRSINTPATEKPVTQFAFSSESALKKRTRLNQSSVLGQVPNTFALMIFSRTAKSSSACFG